MQNAQRLLLTILGTALLSGCWAIRQSNPFRVPYPQLFADSAWVAARAVSFVRFTLVSEGYPHEIDKRYSVLYYARSEDRVRLTLSPTPQVLGGRITLEVHRSGEIRILSREQ
jgi:hypothetical protein